MPQKRPLILKRKVAFFAYLSLQYPLKTSENHRFSFILRSIEKDECYEMG